jgi:hypothetical protein
VTSQGEFGICWSYGSVGLVESETKAKLGLDLNLSEEALAFYHLAELVALTIRDSKTFPRFFSETSRGFNEGHFAKMVLEKKRPGQLDAFDLINKYGLVPESAWSFKVTTDDQRAGIMAAIRTNSIRYLNGVDLTQVSVRDVIDNIMIGDGAFPSEPPAEFAFEGSQVSSKDFVSKVLKFVPDDYVAIEVYSEKDLDLWITMVKRALAGGHTVPLGFPINVDRIDGSAFGAKGVSLDNSVAFASDGGHLVLVTDFVNLGGRIGAVSATELATELGRPAADLDFLRFKNSWGVGTKTDSDGKVISVSPDGYYSISRDYLVAAARGAEKGFLALNAVVPKTVLDP